MPDELGPRPGPERDVTPVGPEGASESAENAEAKSSAFQRNGSGAVCVCSDCGGTPVGHLVTHAETCPVLVGVDRITAVDARYFRRNAKRRKRTPPITWAEQAQVEMSYGWRPTGDVTVRQLQPGVRTRYLTEGGCS